MMCLNNNCACNDFVMTYYAITIVLKNPDQLFVIQLSRFLYMTE